jgi:hypothetical protein
VKFQEWRAAMDTEWERPMPSEAELTANKSTDRSAEDLLKVLLLSGSWYCSAIELQQEADGEALYEEALRVVVRAGLEEK